MQDAADDEPELPEDTPGDSDAEPRDETSRDAGPEYVFPDGLCDRALGGDQAAVDEFWGRMTWMVSALCHILASKYGVRAADVDDVMQDCLLRLSQMPLEKLRDMRNWGGWLYTVVRNRMLSQRRKQARQEGRVASIQESLGTATDAELTLEDLLPAPGPSPSEQAEFADLLRLVEACLEKWRRKDVRRWEAYRLFLHGYKLREIAEKLGITLSLAGVWIFRIRRDLVRCIQDQDNGMTQP